MPDAARLLFLSFKTFARADPSVFVYFHKEGNARRPLYKASHASVTLTIFNWKCVRDDGYCTRELKRPVVAKRIAIGSI